MVKSALVGISAVNYELGESVEFEELDDRARILETIGMIGNPAERGLKTFRVIKGDIFDAAIRSTRKTVADAGMAPREIDGIVLCTSTAVELIAGGRHNIAHLLRESGLVNAFPIGVTFANCANFASALAAAQGLIVMGKFSRILLLALDRYAPRWPTFLSQQERFAPSYVCSDGAASCLIIRDVKAAQYMLLDVSLETDAALMFSQTSAETKVFGHLELLRKVCAATLFGSGLERRQIRQCFMGNYFYNVLDCFSQAIGIEGSRIFRENVSRVGHCYSADNLINLQDFVNQSPTAPGDDFLLLSTGIGQMGACTLRVN